MSPLEDRPWQPDVSMKTPLETLRSVASTGAGLPRLQVRYGILDTNVLLKNIARDVRDDPLPTALRCVIQVGALRPYVGPHVVGEVDRRIDRWMSERGVDGTRARRFWEREYLPRLWVVDTGTLHFEEARIAAVAVRDPDDLPTARLAILLGQKALSEDSDLADYGLASGEPWLRLAFAIGSVAWGEAVDLGIGFGVNLSVESGSQAVALGRQLARTRGGQRALLAAGACVVVVALGVLLLRQLHEPSRLWIDEKTEENLRALASGGQAAIGAYANVARNRFQGELDLQGGIVVDSQTLLPLQVAARRLAAADAPMSTRDLAAVVWGYQRVPAKALSRMTAMLKTMAVFVEVDADHWQLGQPAVLSRA